MGGKGKVIVGNPSVWPPPEEGSEWVGPNRFVSRCRNLVDPSLAEGRPWCCGIWKRCWTTVAVLRSWRGRASRQSDSDGERNCWVKKRAINQRLCIVLGTYITVTIYPLIKLEWNSYNWDITVTMLLLVTSTITLSGWLASLMIGVG